MIRVNSALLKLEFESCSDSALPRSTWASLSVARRAERDWLTHFKRRSLAYWWKERKGHRKCLQVERNRLERKLNEMGSRNGHIFNAWEGGGLRIKTQVATSYHFGEITLRRFYSLSPSIAIDDKHIHSLMLYMSTVYFDKIIFYIDNTVRCTDRD